MHIPANRLESTTMFCRLEIGTTYNSYLVFGEEYTALVDASHEKFKGLYLKTLQEQLKKARAPLRLCVCHDAAGAAAPGLAHAPLATRLRLHAMRVPSCSRSSGAPRVRSASAPQANRAHYTTALPVTRCACPAGAQAAADA
jgi:hypothetical protein